MFQATNLNQRRHLTKRFIRIYLLITLLNFIKTNAVRFLLKVQTTQPQVATVADVVEAGDS